MATTWNIDVFVTPKKGSEDKVRDKLDLQFSGAANIEVNDEWDGHKELLARCEAISGPYDLNKDLPAKLANSVGGDIEEGTLFMKEIEPGSAPFPADTFADLVKRVRKDRSNRLFEEVF
jgi:hypothetical protein